MSKTKSTRNKKIYDIYKNRPDWSLSAIARMFHISQPRAWLIIQQEKLKRVKKP